jgi:hypothetical protein
MGVLHQAVAWLPITTNEYPTPARSHPFRYSKKTPLGWHSDRLRQIGQSNLRLAIKELSNFG